MSLNFTEIVIRIFIIYALILIGSFCRSLLKDPDNSSLNKYLTKVILYIFFPFLVISSIINVNFDSVFIVFISVLFSLVVMFAGFLAVFLYSRLRSIPNKTLGSLFLAISFPNSIFLPFPLILLIIGPAGLLSATLFAVTVTIIQNSLGTYTAIKLGSNGSTQSSFHVSDLVKKIFFFPPTLSMLAGFFLKFTFSPSSFASLFSFLPFNSTLITSSIDLISWISLICALFLVGLTFKLTIHSLSNRFLVPASFFRLGFAPLTAISFLVVSWFFLPPSVSLTSVIVVPLVIQAFSGPAIINIAFAKEFALDVESESIYITILTLISLLLLPFLIILSFALL